MKKISLLALALSMTTTAAFSEVAVVTGAPCPPAPCPCPKAFQGFYLGGNFGYGFGAVKNTVDSPANLSSSKDKIAAQGFDGGLIVGYNYVFSNKLGLGLEAYFNWASTSGSRSYVPARNTGVTDRYKVSMNNAFQLRVPFSYVICNLVAPKVVFGWDNARWSQSVNIQRGFVAGSKHARYNGFLWGVGVDFLLAKHLISGLEFTQTLYGEKTQNLRTTSATTAGTAKCKPLPYNTIKATLKFIY